MLRRDGWVTVGVTSVEGEPSEGLVAESCTPPAISPARLRDLVVGYSLAFLRWVLDDDTTWTELVRQTQPDTTLEQRSS
jgi:hypothetical protein